MYSVALARANISRQGNSAQWTEAFGRRRVGAVLLMLLCSSTNVGCTVTQYRYGHYRESARECNSVAEAESVAVIEYGRPNKMLDRMAWIVGMPSRILPLSSRVNNHDISPETTAKLSRYLHENDLDDVLVRINQYDPKGEWKRLRANSRISPGWKYTFGAGMLVQYTLFPGRVFGGDHYNAYTNTLYVNSDVPAMLILEAAYAKDVHARPMPGPYAAINELPVLETWRLSYGLNDTLGYAQLNDDWELERETYSIVYPIMGIEVALGGHSAISSLASMPLVALPIAAIGGAATGHVLGQTTIKRREREREFDSYTDTGTADLSASEDTDSASLFASESAGADSPAASEDGIKIGMSP